MKKSESFYSDLEYSSLRTVSKAETYPKTQTARMKFCNLVTSELNACARQLRAEPNTISHSNPFTGWGSLRITHRQGRHPVFNSSHWRARTCAGPNTFSSAAADLK